MSICSRENITEKPVHFNYVMYVQRSQTLHLDGEDIWPSEAEYLVSADISQADADPPAWWPVSAVGI